MRLPAVTVSVPFAKSTRALSATGPGSPGWIAWAHRHDGVVAVARGQMDGSAAISIVAVIGWGVANVGMVFSSVVFACSADPTAELLVGSALHLTPTAEGRCTAPTAMHSPKNFPLQRPHRPASAGFPARGASPAMCRCRRRTPASRLRVSAVVGARGDDEFRFAPHRTSTEPGASWRVISDTASKGPRAVRGGSPIQRCRQRSASACASAPPAAAATPSSCRTPSTYGCKSMVSW